MAQFTLQINGTKHEVEARSGITPSSQVPYSVAHQTLP